MTGQIAIANNQVLSQKVLLDEFETDIERRRERQVTSLKVFTLQGLGSAPAAPGGRR
jgi:hypothetical protein